MRELINVQQSAPKSALSSLIHTRFLFSFFIKLLIRLGLASPSLPNVVGMASSVSLILSVSYPTDRVIDGEITNTFLTVVSWHPLHCVHVSQPIAQTSLVWGELMHTPSTGRSICTIICGTIHHFTRLTKTIQNT